MTCQDCGGTGETYEFYQLDGWLPGTCSRCWGDGEVESWYAAP